ncbi:MULTISPECIES: YidH family protein [Pseudonocardia]|uniref:DUF202 domain-containing protein n=1 Tax=Pseudonocardia abyssalis TaxID=2792008 RepID=A0ABS6V0D8_9PSEU|nr:DUF202 domain-containing protein [Pseudonocardia abyssalis]MBW0115136.1 DUF202 domain-containing protein [Pseudonocardia abyssalis]MBW0137975.1 DUF202 domain-containing protein [Pseudonocardia abyssalis]
MEARRGHNRDHRPLRADDTEHLPDGPKGGSDPDYRFALANERTFLAWLRTALALDAGGIAVVTLLPRFGPAGGREAVGMALTALGVAVAAAAVWRWHRVQQAMSRDEDLPPTRMPVLIGAALVLLGATVAVLLALPA